MSWRIFFMGDEGEDCRAEEVLGEDCDEPARWLLEDNDGNETYLCSRHKEKAKATNAPPS